MRHEVQRFYYFEAAHELEAPAFGRSTHIHGHSYKLGVVMDQRARRPTEELDSFWEHDLRARLDHRMLNEEFDDTTVEGLAEALFVQFQSRFPNVVEVFVDEGNLRRGTCSSS